MVREWKAAVRGDGSSNNESLSSAVLMVIWVGLAMLSLITAIIVACGDGASKDKASSTQNDTYGTACAAGCGAGCGA